LRERPKSCLIESGNSSKKHELQSLISSEEEEECSGKQNINATQKITQQSVQTSKQNQVNFRIESECHKRANNSHIIRKNSLNKTIESESQSNSIVYENSSINSNPNTSKNSSISINKEEMFIAKRKNKKMIKWIQKQIRVKMKSKRKM
jgi:hypothetical protein